MAAGSASRFLLALIAVGVAISVGTMVGLGISLIQGDPSPVDPDRPPSLAELGGDDQVSVIGEGDETTVHGPIRLHYSGTYQDGERLILVSADGRQDITTGDGHQDLELADGLYRVQVERTTNDGVEILADRTFEVRTPASPSQVAWAAAIGAAFSATASVIGSLAVSQSAVMVQVAQESLIGFGESKLKEAEEKKKEKMGLTTRRRKRTRAQVRRAVVLAIAITVTLMAVFFTFEEMDAVTGSEFVSKLPLVAPIAGTMALLAFGSEWLLAFATGTVARFKVLWSGAVTLILSSTIFRTAFGFPGYVDEDHGEAEELPKHVEGMRGVAAIAAFPAVLLPFIIIGWTSYDVLSVAMNVGLAGLAAVAMPFRPMPGNDLWRWSKLGSLSLWVGAFVLFFGFELGFMSLFQFLMVGLAGLAILLGTAAWLFVRRQEPGWYRDMLAAIAAANQATPRWIKAPAQFMQAGLSKLDRAIGASAGFARNLAVGALGPVQAWRDERELQKAIDLAKEALDAAPEGVDRVSIVTPNGMDFTFSRAELEDALLARELARLMRQLPRQVEKVTLLDPSTGQDRIIERA